MIEAEIVEALHAARSEPHELSKRIRQRLAHLKGREYFPPERGGKVAVVTKEGKAAVEDALEYLKKQEILQSTDPLPALAEPTPKLAADALKLSCEDHLVDRGSLGVVGHTGADGSSSADRIARYGAWSGACGECLWFGRADTTAATIIEDLVIDDGVADRGHRRCIFDGRFTVAAARLGEHKTFGAMAVIAFATNYEANAEAVRARQSAGPPEVKAAAKTDNAQTQWKLGNCAGCGEPIKGGSVMEVEGLGKFHKDCFCCVDCKKSLAGVPYRKEGRQPFCVECHIEKFAPECKGCGKKISGAGIKLNGEPYHKECKPATAGANGGKRVVKKKAPTSMAGARAGVGGLADAFAGL